MSRLGWHGALSRVPPPPTYVRQIPLVAYEDGVTSAPSFTVPADAQAGDLLIVQCATDSSTALYQSLPNANWTLVGGVNRPASADHEEIVAWALVTSGGNVAPSSTQAFTWSSNKRFFITGVQLRGVKQSAPIHRSKRAQAESAVASLAVTLDSATTVPTLLVGFVMCDAGATNHGFSLTESATERWDTHPITAEQMAAAGYTRSEQTRGAFTFTYNYGSTDYLAGTLIAVAGG